MELATDQEISWAILFFPIHRGILGLYVESIWFIICTPSVLNCNPFWFSRFILFTWRRQCISWCVVKTMYLEKQFRMERLLSMKLYTTHFSLVYKYISNYIYLLEYEVVVCANKTKVGLFILMVHSQLRPRVCLIIFFKLLF